MIQRICIFLIVVSLSSCTREEKNTYDLIIYGATPGGLTAAIQAQKMGLKVLVLEPSKHIGGMTSGGLGWTDFGFKESIGGLSKSFYQLVYAYYSSDSAWKFQAKDNYSERHHISATDSCAWYFEPKAAQWAFNKWIDSFKLEIKTEVRLVEAEVIQERIQQVLSEEGKSYSAAYFIDATYEGDLMALAHVSTHIGRESQATYKESLAGVLFPLDSTIRQPKQFFGNISPYSIHGNLKWGIQVGDLKAPGSGDTIIQAYNFRTCLTNAPDNRLPISKPVNYDSSNYDLLADYIKESNLVELGQILKLSPLPNLKTDINDKCPFSMDYIGANWAYPKATREIRNEIWADHFNYTTGLFWFLGNDVRVPEVIRQQMLSYGLPKDEYPDFNHFTPQLYVREARRLIGQYVMTEHDILSNRKKSTSIGIGSYGPDSHHCQRLVWNGQVINEGNFLLKHIPYEIPMEAILPKSEECKNLLVPVCLSSSHVAYGSIRMEPVFMILGQSAGALVALSKDKGGVENVDYFSLKNILLEEKQVLDIDRVRVE